jgi:hypothetical protein
MLPLHHVFILMIKSVHTPLLSDAVVKNSKEAVKKDYQILATDITDLLTSAVSGSSAPA